VDRALIDQTLKEHRIARENLFDDNAAKELGKMLQADIVCASELRGAEDKIILRCKLIGIVTGEVFASATQILASDSYPEIQRGIEAASETMVRQSGGGAVFTSVKPSIPKPLVGTNDSGKFDYNVSVSSDNKEVTISITDCLTYNVSLSWQLKGAVSVENPRGQGKIEKGGTLTFKRKVIDTSSPVKYKDITFKVVASREKIW
jgi:hypothetical protein